MELEEVTSGLLALRKLYGLLQTSEDGELDAVAVHLDAIARALLKDLLDQASERLLETYSQIITDRLSTRLASSASISWQSVEDSKQIARNSNLDTPSIRNDYGFERAVSYTDATPTAEESTQLLGIYSDRPGTSGKSCTVCVHNSMMQQVSSMEAKIRPMTESEDTQDNHLCKSSVLVRGSRQPPRRRMKIQPTNSTFAEAESSNGEIYPNRDLSYAIKRIEAQILVLQHLSGLGSPFESAGRQAKDREMEIPSWVGNRITRSPSSTRSPLKENSESTTVMVGLSNVRAPNARISSRTSNFVHRFHVPESPAESEMSSGLTVNKEPVRKVVQPRVLVPSQDSVTSVSSRNRMSTRRKNLKLAYQMESEESSSGSRDSSSYSSSTRSSQLTSSSSGFPSEYYSRSYTDYTDFSQGSRRESEDSSSFSSYSVPRPHKPTEPSLRKVSPAARRSRSPNPRRAVGKLRKIKNKLGLIFHHHHHHHHHHRNENEEDSVHKSKWKSVGDNILRVPNKNQLNGGRKIIDKSKKSVDKRGQGGHFHTLVEGLLRHIRRSKKKKKMMKNKKVRLPDPNGTKGNAKKKKLHWWQMMRRRGGSKLPKGGHQPKLKLPDKRAQLGAAKG